MDKEELRKMVEEILSEEVSKRLNIKQRADALSKQVYEELTDDFIKRNTFSQAEFNNRIYMRAKDLIKRNAEKDIQAKKLSMLEERAHFRYNRFVLEGTLEFIRKRINAGMSENEQVSPATFLAMTRMINPELAKRTLFVAASRFLDCRYPDNILDSYYDGKTVYMVNLVNGSVISRQVHSEKEYRFLCKHFSLFRSYIEANAAGEVILDLEKRIDRNVQQEKHGKQEGCQCDSCKD